MIQRICQLCKTHFQVYPSDIKAGRGKSCSRLCANKHLGQKHKGVPRPENVRKKISKGHIGKIVSLETRNNMSKAHRGQEHSVKQRQRMSQTMSGSNNPFYDKKHTVEAKEAMSTTHKRDWQDPKYKAKQVQIAKELWQDPKYIEKMMLARQAKPNKLEGKLIEILNKHLPQFKYNGDFSLGITLGGLIPDFVNINGKKEIIEIFGDYWHSSGVLGDRWQRTELGRIMAYNSLGYKCLVIWEHELKELPEEKIVAKIKTFQRRKYAHATQGRIVK